MHTLTSWTWYGSILLRKMLSNVNNMKETYNKRLKRINDAISLKEPDRVPMLTPGTMTFPYFDAGYTMADVIYDAEKAKDAIRKYLTKYEPDTGHVYTAAFEGMGPILEKEQIKTVFWAGMPENKVDENSIHQFIEFPTLNDAEFYELNHNKSKWAYCKYLPRIMGVYEPLRDFDSSFDFLSYRNVASIFAKPDIKKMISTLTEINALLEKRDDEIASFSDEVESMGFPVMMGGITENTFDIYSDYLRGTLLGCTDLYDHPDEVYAFILDETEKIVERIKTGSASPGKYVFIPMHKGMDGFLSDEQYEKFYFEPFLKIIDAIISIDMIPYLYTEGKYNSRIGFLKQVPKGKTIIHFEEVDVELAKRELKDIACITGAYPSTLLETGSVGQVIDEAKKLLDILAPGGGYMFELAQDMHICKRENVEALYNTIKTYGKY